MADRYRRLHVIIGDANHLDVATLLKTGTTSLVLGMIEDGHLTEDWSIRRPVAALQTISHDPDAHGHRRARRRAQRDRPRRPVDVPRGGPCLARPARRRPRGRGDGRGHGPLGGGRSPASAATSCRARPLLDWVAKLKLLEGYRARDGLAWDDHRLAAIDIQWADVRPEKGLVHRLRDRGMLRDLVTPEEVKAAQTTPPEDTRAWFRGECVRRFTSQVFSASWDSVVFDVPGRASLQRVPILEPERGTRAQVGTLLEQSADVGELLRGLATPE